jgi:SAM-dependent methyltransferase
MYSVLDYGHMAADTVRMDAYARAIARIVKPGDVVVDVGAGTGIFSLLAARAGARRVHAIDPNPAVWLAAELARENGLADRIVVHAAPSFEVKLDEPADVVVSDVRGSFPLAGEHLAILRDARTRLLRPGGTLLPTRDRLFVGAVEAPRIAASLARGTEGFTARGLSSDAARLSILNTLTGDGGAELRANELLTNGDVWATLEYGTSAGPIEGEVTLVPRRCGRARALAMWFEATIADGLVYDNAPGNVLVYSRYCLPLLEPVDLDEGDRMQVVIRADERGDRWGWDTRVTSAAGAVKASFRQSTFLGMPTSPAALLRSSSTHAPGRSARGKRLGRILELMDGARTVDAIADLLVSEASAPLPRAVLLDEVRSAVERYGE